MLLPCGVYGAVSTHSRLKAAGRISGLSRAKGNCFNTQPPEGGWKLVISLSLLSVRFNTQPPEGGWPPEGGQLVNHVWFQHTAA